MSDPYLESNRNIQLQLKLLKGKLEKSNTATSADPDIRDALADIQKETRDIEFGIGRVEKNRARFPSITDIELNRRKEFLKASQDSLAIMTDKFRAPRISDAELLRRNAAASSEAKASPSSGASYVKQQQIKQQQAIAAQDEILDSMANVLDNLKNNAEEIGSNLEEQKVLLDGLDGNMTEAKDRFELTLGKIDKLLGKKDSGRWCLLIGLALLAVLFLCLDIWI